MPNPSRRKHRTWFIAWALLCAAGLAATEALTDTSPADTDCADRIGDIEARVAEQRTENSDRALVVAWTGTSSGQDDECLDELREHFAAKN
ncbi:hypothetical protein ACWFQ6_01650 [Streptomyces althioticus]